MRGQGCQTPRPPAGAKRFCYEGNEWIVLTSQPPSTGGLPGHFRDVYLTRQAPERLLPPQGVSLPRESMRPPTRKQVSYACAGGSRGKPRWTPAAVLTCKSIVKRGYRGERPIELASSWFRSKFPPGKLAPIFQLAGAPSRENDRMAGPLWGSADPQTPKGGCYVLLGCSVGHYW